MSDDATLNIKVPRATALDFNVFRARRGLTQGQLIELSLRLLNALPDETLREHGLGDPLQETRQ